MVCDVITVLLLSGRILDYHINILLILQPR